MLSLRTDLPEDRIQVSENQKTYEIRPSDLPIGRFDTVPFPSDIRDSAVSSFHQTRWNWSKATTYFSNFLIFRHSKIVPLIIWRNIFTTFETIVLWRRHIYLSSIYLCSSTVKCYFSFFFFSRFGKDLKYPSRRQNLSLFVKLGP